MIDRQADVLFAFSSSHDAPRNARRAVAAMMGESDPIAMAVALAVSELVTNVVLHSTGGGAVKLWNPGADGRVRVEVEDHSPNPPVRGGEQTVGGRGLQIVDSVAEAWGIVSTGHGNLVWAEFSRPLPPDGDSQ